MTYERLIELFYYDQKTGIFTWRLDPSANVHAGDQAGWIDNYGYHIIQADGRNYRASRLAWLYMTGEWPEYQIDHINLIKKDNRWCNLRQATCSQNMANRTVRFDNLSGLKGVSKCRNKWVARVNYKGKRVFQGTFHTAEAAHAAYSAVHSWHFKEYART